MPKKTAASPASAIASAWEMGQPGASAWGRSKSSGSKSTQRPPQVQLDPPSRRLVDWSRRACPGGSIAAAWDRAVLHGSSRSPPDSMTTVETPARPSARASDMPAGPAPTTATAASIG